MGKRKGDDSSEASCRGLFLARHLNFLFDSGSVLELGVDSMGALRHHGVLPP